MKILVVVTRFPWPARPEDPRRGDQVRSGQLLDLLARRHQVTLLAPRVPAARAPESLLARVEIYRAARRHLPMGAGRAVLGGLPWQSALYHQPDLRRRLRELAPASDLVVLQLARLADYPRELHGVPYAVDFIDSLALNFERRAQLDLAWLRPFWRVEGRRLRRAEQRLLAGARGGWLVCERDRRFMAERTPADLRARLRVVRLAISGADAERAPESGRVVTLSGNLGYFANHEAASWLLREVWPAISGSGVRLVLAGARARRSLARRAGRAGVELRAAPRDLGAVLRQADLALAPLHAGSGVPIKILEAWAHGVPVLASPWAAAGTDATPGRELEVAESAADWIEAIPRLLADRERRRDLATAGSRLLLERHALAAVDAELALAVAEATGPAGSAE